jgi:hypothetical protein
MPDPRRPDRGDPVPWPYRQFLERARHPTGWRSSMVTRPNQSVRSFALEVLIAGGAFILIVVVLMQFG